MPIPTDFPSTAYERLSALVKTYDESIRTIKGQPTDSHREFIAAHNTLQWRYRAVVDADESYRAAYVGSNVSGDIEKRYDEERELFNFFVSFVSAVEVLCYCSFAIAAMIDPTHFPLSTERDRRAVDPGRTKGRFAECFGNDSITDDLNDMLSTYADANKMRNLLSHRGSPPRHVFVGDSAGDRTEWGQFKIDSQTTANLRPWLAQHVEAVIVGLCQFGEDHLERAELPG